MKRVLALAAVIAAVGFAMPANAQQRVIIYPGQGPQSAQANQQARFTRLAFGTWIRIALGSQLGAGAFSGLSVVPNGGMNVAVQPATAGTPGAIIQACALDANPIPTSASPQLSADSSVIGCLATLSVSSGSIGPATAPGSGLSQYYLVEAKLTASDTNSQSIMFVNSNGSQSYSTVPTFRGDTPSYQLKAGIASSSPVVPSADTGYVGIGTVLIPSGTATITSGMIAMLPSFAGFIANGANVSVTGLTISSQGAGCLQTNGSGVVSAQTCTSGLGAVVSGDSKVVANTVSGTATVTCPTCITSVTAGTGITATPSGSSTTVGLSHGDYIDQGSSAQARTGALTTGPLTSTGNITAGTASGTQVAIGPQVSIVSNGSTSSNNTLNAGFAGTNSGAINLYANGFSNGASQSFLANGGATFGNTITAPNVTVSSLTTPGVVTNSSAGVLGSTTAPAISGANFTPSSIPNNTLVNTPLVGLTPGTGINVGGGTTPSVGIANNGVGQAQVVNGYMDLSGVQTIGGNKSFSAPLGAPSYYANGNFGAGIGSYIAGGTSGAGIGWNASSGGGEASLVTAYNGSKTASFWHWNGSAYALSSQIASDGTYSAGSSTYGPASATVNGPVAAAVNATPNNGGLQLGSTTVLYSTDSLSTILRPYATGGSVYVNNNANSTNNAHFPDTGGLVIDRGSVSVGSSSYGPTSATVNGNLVTSGGGFNTVWGNDGANTSFIQAGTGGFHMINAANSGYLYSVDGSGNLTATSFNVSSRREWKKNITSLKDPLAAALALPVYAWSYNGKGGKPNEPGTTPRHIGPMANDAPEYLSGPKHDHIDEGSLTGLTLAAVQQLAKTVDALVYDNKVLRDRLAAMVAARRVMHPGWHRVVAFEKGHCPRGTVPKRDKHGRIIGCTVKGSR